MKTKTYPLTRPIIFKLGTEAIIRVSVETAKGKEDFLIIHSDSIEDGSFALIGLAILPADEARRQYKDAILHAVGSYVLDDEVKS